MSILLAGGAGYIGSHTAVELLSAGYDIVIADNYSNSKPEAVRRIKQITGKSFPMYEVDICDGEALSKVFERSISIRSSISQDSKRSANPWLNPSDITETTSIQRSLFSKR